MPATVAIFASAATSVLGRSCLRWMLPLLMPPSLLQQLLSLSPSLPHVVLLSLPLLILTPHHCRPGSPLAASTAIFSITAAVTAAAPVVAVAALTTATAAGCTRCRSINCRCRNFGCR